MNFRLLDMLALSLRVVAVNTDEGWRLSDGYRFTEVYAGPLQAMDDQDTIRRLTFGEELLNQEKG